ncbi:MAG: DMT family transporter [Frankiaceae bacterium]
MSRESVPLAVAASLAAAGAFGVASALQHAESLRVDRRAALDPGLLTSLLRRPLWLFGVAADMLAVTLQAVGLRYGPVALVQPLLVAGLPVAVTLSCRLDRRRLRRSEALGVLLSSAGLALLAPTTATSGLGRPPDRLAGLVAALVLGLTVGLLLLLARHDPSQAAVATGCAAGIVVGAGSVLLAVSAGRIGNPAALFTSVAPYATVAVGLLGLLLSQAAFQTGALGTPLAALSVTEPVMAVALAVVLLHERLPTTPLTRALALVGATAAVGGVVALTRGDRSSSTSAAVVDRRRR